MRRKIMERFLITLFLGWAGIHKFMDKKTGLGILYLCTFGLFGIGWIIDTIIAFKNMSTNMKQRANTQYIDSLYSEMNQQLSYNSAARIYIDNYYKGEEEIQSMWSVM